MCVIEPFGLSVFTKLDKAVEFIYKNNILNSNPIRGPTFSGTYSMYVAIEMM